jgi:sialate O-acetylesterase
MDYPALESEHGRSFVTPCLSLLLFALVSGGPASADVRLPTIFGSHMVLEQDIKIPVWGWADAGEAVTVTLGDHTAKTTADATGKWRVDLDPVTTTTTPLTLTVTGKNSLKFDDVLIGDVWVCSGQSNMEFDLGGNWGGKPSFGGAANAATAVPAANDPQLRLFVVQKKIALEPESDVAGKWEVCTPDSAALFSAVGYFFGQELRHNLNRPIGLIGTYWGGMPAQAFTSLSGLQKDPPFTNYISAYQKDLAGYPKAKAEYPAAMAAYQAKLKEWNETVAPTYNATLKQWQEAVNQAKTSGQPAPPKPVPSTPIPRKPNLPEGAPGTPTVLYNGMIAPLIPYAIKGAIWYQGEANAGNGPEYAILFPRMITNWREKWNEGNFPFLYVQLANYMKPQVQPSEGGWAYLREAQLKTLALPNTGMASTIDIGNGGDIHPKDKLDVGLRLALAAKHIAYGQDLVYSGPIYDSMTVEGNKIRLTFKDTGSGLQMGTPPWTPTGVPVPASTELTGFAIAGADKNWVWAKAQIDGTTVVVSSDQVASPVAVRYGWANNPPCNLYNKEGLPASPFRTDDWTDPKPAPVKPVASSAPNPKP